jgi:hypothetical protein
MKMYSLSLPVLNECLWSTFDSLAVPLKLTVEVPA